MRVVTSILATVLACLVPVVGQTAIEIDTPGITRQLRNNILAFLSLSRYADRDDVPAETMSRLERRIIPEVRQALQPLGYYEPQVTHQVTRQRDGWLVTIQVDPGRPVRVSEVNINLVGDGAEDPALLEILARREVKPGLRLNHGTYEKVKGDLLRRATNDGYLDARFTTSELLVDRQQRRSFITLELDTGRRYYFGAITTIQDTIQPEAMTRLLRMSEGDPYTLDALLRTQYVLDDSQYFASVSIETGQPNRETLRVPVTVRADQNRRHRYAASAGYASDTKARGRLTWDNRLVNRRGHRSQVEIIGSSIRNEASFRYVIPVMDLARTAEQQVETGVARRSAP